MAGCDGLDGSFANYCTRLHLIRPLCPAVRTGGVEVSRCRGLTLTQWRSPAMALAALRYAAQRGLVAEALARAGGARYLSSNMHGHEVRKGSARCLSPLALTSGCTFIRSATGPPIDQLGSGRGSGRGSAAARWRAPPLPSVAQPGSLASCVPL
jgi:hypothetical protein